MQELWTACFIPSNLPSTFQKSESAMIWCAVWRNSKIKKNSEQIDRHTDREIQCVPRMDLNGSRRAQIYPPDSSLSHVSSHVSSRISLFLAPFRTKFLLFFLSRMGSRYWSISAARARAQQQTSRTTLLLSIDGTDRRTDGHPTVT